MSPVDLPERIASKISVDPDSGCWPWIGRTHRGYGQIDLHRPDGFKTVGKAHRVVYQTLVGAVPEGLVLDHLCRNRACCNPAHLEVVTQQVNILRGEGLAAKQARQTHCKHGHAFDEENTYITPAGSRVCRFCSNEKHRRMRARKKEAAA